MDEAHIERDEREMLDEREMPGMDSATDRDRPAAHPDASAEPATPTDDAPTAPGTSAETQASDAALDAFITYAGVDLKLTFHGATAEILRGMAMQLLDGQPRSETRSRLAKLIIQDKELGVLRFHENEVARFLEQAKVQKILCVAVTHPRMPCQANVLLALEDMRSANAILRRIGYQPVPWEADTSQRQSLYVGVERAEKRQQWDEMRNR